MSISHTCTHTLAFAEGQDTEHLYKLREVTLIRVFAVLIIEVSRIIMQSDTDMEEFQAYVSQIFPESCSCWTQGSDYRKILHAISDTKGWSRTNYLPLFELLKAFVDKETEAKRDDYEARVVAHFVIEVIFNWMKTDMSFHDSSPPAHSPPPPDLDKLSSKLKRHRITERAIHYVRDMWNGVSKRFRIPKLEVVLHGIQVGCMYAAKHPYMPDNEGLHPNFPQKIGALPAIHYNIPKTTMDDVNQISSPRHFFLPVLMNKSSLRDTLKKE